MKTYLLTTGSLFAFLALAHLWRTAAEWQRLTTDPLFAVEDPGIGLIAAALTFWAWRLLRLLPRAYEATGR